MLLPSILLSTLALLSSTQAAPQPTQPLSLVVKRATPFVFTNTSIPTECQSPCASAIPISEKCKANDLPGCEKICEDQEMGSYYGCVNCLLVFDPQHRQNPQTYYDTEKYGMINLVTACQKLGFSANSNVSILTYDEVVAEIANTTAAAIPSSTASSATGGASKVRWEVMGVVAGLGVAMVVMM